MKFKLENTVEVKYLQIKVGVRYWEDGTVNGKEDTDGTLIPLRDGDYWCPFIDVDTGKIMHWPQGTATNLHYKVCDDGVYKLLDVDKNVLVEYGAYVPNMLSPVEDGLGII